LPESKWKRRPADLVDALRLHTITVGELMNPTQSLQHIDRIALTIDWLRNVINDPFGDPWPKQFTPVTPIDLGLKQVSKGLLAGRRVLLEWFQRASSAAIRGIEGVYRASAESAEGHEWETASVWRDDEPAVAIAADMPTARDVARPFVERAAAPSRAEDVPVTAGRRDGARVQSRDAANDLRPSRETKPHAEGALSGDAEVEADQPRAAEPGAAWPRSLRPAKMRPGATSVRLDDEATDLEGAIAESTISRDERTDPHITY